MRTSSNYKPVGGVESCALYPDDSVVTAIFSSEGCTIKLEGSPVEVPLLDDASSYDESTLSKQGATSVLHSLRLVADRGCAEEWLEEEFLERAAFEGFVAIITLNDGRRLLAGYSSRLNAEQPLRLGKIVSTSGNALRETPSVTLELVSYDAEFSPEILEIV